MPLYETVMQEKPPIVLDIGMAYTKLGFAAEPHPRKIIPTEVIRSSDGRTCPLFEYASTTELYDQLVDFLEEILFKYLLISPKERKFIIVENIFGQSTVRETLARVLFYHFDISSIYFVSAHLMALSTLAIETAIVVDMGYSECSVLPIYANMHLMNCFQDQPFGSKSIHAQLRQKLLEAGVECAPRLSEATLEDIKIRTCFVTKRQRALDYRQAKPPTAPPSVSYPVDADTLIEIPGQVRETAYEFMFEESIERDSLPHLILQAIVKSPVDARRKLAENIFVIGGTAMIIGLLSRLQEELSYLLRNDDEYKQQLAENIEFKFHKPLAKQNFAAWQGASICGATDLVTTNSLTKEAYIRLECVPEWTQIHLRGNA